ncbi:hypothetical protein [Streptacidiphilus sp. EB129]|uniref:hypothetical protein n=1 Tax=Streptacidiphilus sp. EB129 TaxID=3156262 RepID=UPI00351442DC
MLKVTGDHAGLHITFVGTQDDPRGWISKAHTAGHLENMLAALGDEMAFANVKADGNEADEQLRAVSWFIEQLGRRRDALIVAQKDRGASWTDLARLVDPEDPEPMARRSAMQRRYEAGRRRTGLPS